MVGTPVAARVPRWAAVAALLLAACGQGGQDSPGAAAPGTEPPPVASTSLPAPTPGDGMDPDETDGPLGGPRGRAHRSRRPAAPTVPAPEVTRARRRAGRALPSDPAGADLVLVAGPEGAQQPPVTLVCDWAAGTASGTHPQAEQACADLRAALASGDPFAPVAPDAMCTQQYGGDAVVQVSGAVLAADGAPVDVAATFTLTDGCQIARFDATGAVLAPFRGTV